MTETDDGDSTPTESEDDESSSTTGTILAADSVSLSPGEPGSVGLVLEQTPEGMAGFRTTLALADSDVATIESASVESDFQNFSSVTVADDGSRVTIEAIDDQEVAQDEDTDVRLATLTIEGVSTGSTSLHVEVDRFDDDSGRSVDPETTDGTIEVG